MNLINILKSRPTSRGSGTGAQNQNGVSLQAGIADDQSKDFDFEKTEMKYDSTGMFHWCPAKNLEECILVIISKKCLLAKRPNHRENF
jgi:potassium large conductance calcium-activated channel subfamily M alpha protein 1